MTTSKIVSTEKYDYDGQEWTVPAESAPLSEADSTLLEKLKEALPTPCPLDETTLIRFTRGYWYEKKREETTLKYLNDHIKTREDFKLDQITESIPEGYPEFDEAANQFEHGVDVFGHPVKIMSLKHTNFSYLKKAPTDKIKVFSFYRSEVLLKRLAEESAKRGKRIYQVFSIIDMKDIGVFSGLSSLNTMIGKMTSVLENNYPELSFKTFIVNVSFTARAFIKVILAFVNEKSSSKIFVWGSGQSMKDELAKHVSKKFLPKALGGECECDACKILNK